MLITMKNSALIFVLFAVYAADADTDDKKWVWASRRNDGGQRVYTGVASSNSYAAALVAPSDSLFRPSSDLEGTLSPQATKLRYQVSEPSDYPKPPSSPNRPSIYPEEQYRPTTTTINGFRPDSYRPNQDNFRPGNRPNQNGFRPNQNGFRPPEDGYRPSNNNGFRPQGGSGYRPGSGPGSYRPTTGPNGRPVLTGPVPSWEQGNDQRYRDYDRCKCVYSFNCNTPGIKFGSCDADKQYCCYNDLDGDRPSGSGNFQGGNVRDRPRPVLAGPGGPIDQPGQYRPYKDGIANRPSRPNFNNNNNRYSDGFRGTSNLDEGLDEAYKKGLESAIQETFQKPSRFQSGRREFGGYQDNFGDDSFNRRPRPNHKYGLYEPSGYDFYGGRAANSTIEAEPERKNN